jgi:hypothetical protein
MSRQLRISEDVHEMLTLLKPHNSTSYDDVIRDLITDVCPYLPGALQDLKLLEQTSAREAAGERLLLQNEIFEDVVVNRLLRKREDEDEAQIDRHLDSLLTDKQKEEDNQLKERVADMRHRSRRKILHETERTEENSK